jgi:hypothetical protein
MASPVILADRNIPAVGMTGTSAAARPLLMPAHDPVVLAPAHDYQCQESHMQVQPQPQDTQAIAVVILIIAGLCVAYWKVALRVFVIGLVALAILGTVAGLHTLHIIR